MTLRPLITRFRVQSCADGSLRVKPVYRRARGRPGVITRMAIAREVQKWLNGRVR